MLKRGDKVKVFGSGNELNNSDYVPFYRGDVGEVLSVCASDEYFVRVVTEHSGRYESAFHPKQLELIKKSTKKKVRK